MRFKKLFMIICLLVCLFAMASACASDNTGLELSANNDDNLQTNEESPALDAGDNDESVSVESDSEILTNGRYNYTYLREQIGSGGNTTLAKGTYTYNESDGDTIEISIPGVIDGNGAVIDMAGLGKRVFIVTASDVTIKNLSIKNANFNGDGGAIYFSHSGNVTNCNFTNNIASGVGGAIYFTHSGNVTNCNFAHNSAKLGGSILSRDWWGVTADTCIFQTSSDEPYFTHNLPPTLNVDNFTTLYRSGEKLTFDLRTNSSMQVTNGNISISAYFKDNNTWVGNYSCISGEGWIPDLPVGSYNVIFNTEYAEFQPINRTMKVIPNIKYYANVTSLATGNMTVNITVKSNIAQEILEGKLVFILPNTTALTANYIGNGTWWAVHTFDNYGHYKINTSYSGFDNITINNATIAINKGNSTITLDDVVLNYGDSISVNVITGSALAITAMIDGEDVGVVKFAIPISGLNAGIHTLTVTTIPDYEHVQVTKTVNVTVNKAANPLKVKAKTVKVKFSKLKKKTQTLKVTNVVQFTKKGQGTLTYKKVSGNKKIAINKKNGKVTIKKGLKKGTYKVKVKIKANGNANYKASTFKTVTFKIIIK